MRINVNLGEGINSNAYKGQNGNETSDRVDIDKRYYSHSFLSSTTHSS